MRSPAEMNIIQIDITNACMFSCSNCTRFCGQHPKPFFMEPETFRRAVDSLDGFEGVIGIIGGEPTLHPQFDQLVSYYSSKVPEPRPRAFIQQPVDSFSAYARTVKYMRGRSRGLFTSLGNGYYRNFEQIQDVFAYQSINDHQSVNTHQAILITRKELGIPDQEWFRLRDSCWIQNLWSASITPKGAFFCEIAACLDMLFDGPGGWPIEPGWWKRTPADFGDQLHWCEMCSMALKVPTMDATHQTDIVSPAMAEKLKKINGPKIRNQHFAIFDPSAYEPSQYGHARDPIWYLQEQGDMGRVSPTHESLFPRRIDVAVRNGHSSEATLELDRVTRLDFNDWVAVFRDEAAVSQEFLSRIRRCVLNPGCFYHEDRVWLFHRRAKALRGAETICLDDCLRDRWENKKRVALRNYPCVGRATRRERLSLLVKEFVNRAAFLLPIPRRRFRAPTAAEGDPKAAGCGVCTSPEAVEPLPAEQIPSCAVKR